ncbi:MAG: M48 family metallopeptidase [Nannocystaceae bacterium]|nr:M48 family metallopeptidase [Nannocystaceae bacterium]
MSERKRGQDLTRIGTALALAFLVAGLSLPFVSRLGGLLLPQSTRAQIGDALVESVPQDQFCRSKAGLAALHSVVQKLSEASGSDQEFRVYVAHSKQLNAFAAPGGRLVILSPIIEQARNPEEMAGTLAHEMAHVLERHPSTGIVKSLGLGVLSLLNPGAERLGAGVAETLRERKNSRNDELDADRVGVELLNTAGFDSRGSIGFFERIMDKGSDTPPRAAVDPPVGRCAYRGPQEDGQGGRDRARRRGLEGCARRLLGDRSSAGNRRRALAAASHANCRHDQHADDRDH